MLVLRGSRLAPPPRGACACAEAALAGGPASAPETPRVTQEAARRSEVKMAARASGEWSGLCVGLCHSHLWLWTRLALCWETSRAVRGSWCVLCALDGGSARSSCPPGPGGRVSSRPSRAVRVGVGLSGGSLAPVPTCFRSGGAEGAREHWRSPWAAPHRPRGSLSSYWLRA